jgi:hypothetical protein
MSVLPDLYLIEKLGVSHSLTFEVFARFVADFTLFAFNMPIASNVGYILFVDIHNTCYPIVLIGMNVRIVHFVTPT